MSVDLNDYVDSLKREVNPPGTNLYPDARGGEWSGHLRDAFWQSKLFGLLTGFTENAAARGGPDVFGEGIVTPIGAEEDYDATDDMTPEFAQLVVIHAGYRILLTKLLSMKSSRYKAGSVEYETQQQAASVVKGLLDAAREKLHLALDAYSNITATDTAVFDAVIERTYSQAVGDSWWMRGVR